MRIRRILGLIMTALVVTVACAAPPSGGSGRGSADAPRASAPKRISAAITGSPPYLVHQFDTSTNKPGWGEMANLYSSSLTTTNEAGVIAPQLAEATPTVENGNWRLFPDGTMETRWAIKPGAAWHDGTPFTTRDLLFGYEIARDRELPQSINRALTYVERVDAPDLRTIVVRWNQPYIQADRLFGGSPLPAHILDTTYRADKQVFLGHPYMTTEFVGTGPFKLAHFEPGSHVSLSAFDQYVLGRPKIDEVEVRFILDLNTLVTNVLAGTVDLTLGRGVSTEQGVQVRDIWREGRVDFPYKSWVVFYGQYIDPNPPVVADVRFHRALMHAINRQEMVDTIQYGMTAAAEIPLGPNHPSYQQILARVPRYPYDLRRADQLFQELGYTKGPDGALRDGAGQRLELEIRTTGELDIHLKGIVATANYLRQAGMSVNETVIPTLRAGDRPYRVSFPALEMLRGPFGEDALVGLMHSSRIPTPANAYSSGNYPRYHNAQWDALLDRYALTIPYGERMNAMSDLIHFLEDQLPQMSLFYDTQVVLVSNRLANVESHKTGLASQGFDAEIWDARN